MSTERVILSYKSKELDIQSFLKKFKSNKNILKTPVLIRLY